MYDWAVRRGQGEWKGKSCPGYKKVCIRYVIIRISQKIIITFAFGVGGVLSVVGGSCHKGLHREKDSDRERESERENHLVLDC